MERSSGPLSSEASQAVGAAAVEPASRPQPGVIHGERRDRGAWLLPCVKSLRVMEKLLESGPADLALSRDEGSRQPLRGTSWRLRLWSLELEPRGGL